MPVMFVWLRWSSLSHRDAAGSGRCRVGDDRRRGRGILRDVLRGFMLEIDGLACRAPDCAAAVVFGLWALAEQRLRNDVARPPSRRTRRDGDHLTRALAFASPLVRRGDRVDVFEPLIADWQRELDEARDGVRPRRQRWLAGGGWALAVIDR